MEERKDRFQESMDHMEEWALDTADGWRESVRDKYGRLGLLAYGAIPILYAATFSGIGRATESPLISATPLALALFSGGTPRSTRGLARLVGGIAKVAIGTALPYADIIYESISDKL
jgi:hypothetical protein